MEKQQEMTKYKSVYKLCHAILDTYESEWGTRTTAIFAEPVPASVGKSFKKLSPKSLDIAISTGSFSGDVTKLKDKLEGYIHKRKERV